MPLVLLGGVKSLSDLDTAMQEGFELCAMGRALIHDPDLIGKYRTGTERTSGCEPCNQCVAEMDREGGVCCAKVPTQLAFRADQVRQGKARAEVARHGDRRCDSQPARRG
jgi:hypothetical protein